MDAKVLITCSGLGSRLGEITNYTNKSLVRVGEKPVISHIIDSYPKGTKFVITVGHHASHVMQYVKLAYPDKDVTFVQVDKFEGKGSSLAYSMLCAQEFLQSPFIFHACDTIVDNEGYDANVNSVWLSRSNKNKSNYRTAFVSEGLVKSIQEKGADNGDIYVGKTHIKDYEDFWKSLQEIYREHGQDDSTLSDCHSVNALLASGHKFKYVISDKWFDIGNLDSLQEARSKFGGDVNVLYKSDESIYFVDGKVIKFFHDERTTSNRVKRAEYLLGVIPKISNFSKNFFSYNRVEGETLSRFQDFNDEVLTSLLNWANDKLWSKSKNIEFSKYCENFYVEKTLSRVRQYEKTRKTIDKQAVINGMVIPPVYQMLNVVKKNITEKPHPSAFHGDFILENVIISSSGMFTLIDWRQDFSGLLDIGDAYYDLAKMNHNLVVNHDIINAGLYEIKFHDEGKINVDVMCKKKFIDAKNCLRDFCLKNGFNIKKIDILTAIVWINMAPIHDIHFGDFLYHFGKYNLFKAIKELE